HGEAEHEDQGALPTGGSLGERLSAETVTHSTRDELALGQPLHRVEHLARAIARFGSTVHDRRGKAIESLDQAGATLKLGADEGGDGDHGAVGPPHVEATDVFRFLPELRLGFQLNPIGTAIQVEVVDVERRKHRLQSAEDVSQVYSQ